MAVLRHRKDNYQKLIFLLILLLTIGIAILIGCRYYIKSRDNISYEYQLTEVDESQVIFACRYQNFAWGDVDQLLLVNKNGQCKLIDLADKKDVPQKDDNALLEYFDSCFENAEYEYLDENITFEEQELLTAINLSEVSLKRTDETSVDAGTYTYYSVFGIEEERKLNVIKVGGDNNFLCKNAVINDICEKLEPFI